MKRLLIISFIIFACSMNASNMHDFLAFTDLSSVLMKHQDCGMDTWMPICLEQSRVGRKKTVNGGMSD